MTPYFILLSATLATFSTTATSITYFKKEKTSITASTSQS